jgi:GTP-binding protein EngB required for normal cell division
MHVYTGIAMEVPTQRMRKEILEIRGFLTEGLFLALTPEERQALLASSQKLLDRLDALSDQVLVAGLVGGTGVGKSTVMNALAGAEIASTSHRRPNTDRVLLYRHEGVELPRALTKTAVPWHEVIHQADGVRQIIMCDLPDFDSLVGEHRERVLRFLEHLDVLVFVTSPEKYADHALYAFLEGVPKARPNFTFVLNKVDLLFQGEDLEQGYKQLASLAGLFQEYLQKAEVSEPLVFPVSAEEAIRNPVASPWNQFPAFRREIFRDREAKEVMAIKSSNLDREVRELLSRLQAEIVHIDSLGRVLDEFAKQFEDERGEWEKQGQEILDAWVDTRMKGYVLDRLKTLAPLVGPGYGIARVVQEWRSWKGEKREEARPPSPEEASEPPGALRDQLENAENRVLHKALQGSVPASYRDRLQATLGIEGAWEAFSARWKQQVELRLLAQRAPLLVGFRVVQYITYLTLLVLLVMALADEEAGRRFLADPGWASSFQVLFSIVKSLFSMTGLGAVVTFGLIQVLLGAIFYKRYKARLERRARKTLLALKRDLGRIWSGELDRVQEALKDCWSELGEQRKALAKRLDRE